MSKNHLIQSAAAQLLVQQAFTPTSLSDSDRRYFIMLKHHGRIKPHSNRHKRLRAAVFQYAKEYAKEHSKTIPNCRYRRHNDTGVITVDTQSIRGGILAAKREVRQRKSVA